MSKRAKAQQAARAAHERRLREQQRARRQRTVWVSALAVAVLVAAGVIGVVAWQASRPEDVAVPTAATADGAGLPVGDGPVTVEIYLDFNCPACATLEQTAGPTLQSYLEQGTVTVVYRPIAILDRNTTTEYSTRAAAAAGCAADYGDNLEQFVAEMMAAQPAGNPAGLSDEEIIAIGGQAGISDPQFGQCVRDGTYEDWVGRSTNEAFDRGVQGTPTVFVDGERVEQLSVEELVARIEAAAG